jgi:hypothetical protein
MIFRMNLGLSRRFATPVLLALVTGVASGAADAQSSVSGEGFGAKVNIGGQVTTAAEARLSASGGIGLADLDSVGLAGSVTSSWATTATTGAVGAATVSAQTVASVEDVIILGGRIRAKFVTAVASSTANGTGASSNALGSVMTDLVINGTAMGSGDLVPGPNTRIDLPGVGFVLLNEQTRVGDGIRISGLSVNMIHVVLLDPLTGAKTGDIIVGSASSAANF